MGVEIDNRIVEMEFDNKNFEKNASKTLGTIDRLNSSLSFKGAQKGFEQVNTSARKVDLSSLGNALENVHMKFSAMDAIAFTTFQNLTNMAFRAGKNILSALTIDPIRTGFSEYETKIGSIQTIMSNTASKGTTLKDVTRVIDELNLYADKTIYNFSEMTRNIGTFTAAGVGLEESASAIQGIANLAAASGSTSQQASTAMYQLSQALAAGTVHLQDWNSVVNAGMGGEKFQEALKQTAREHGIAVDAIIKKRGSFRESLRDDWISAEIMSQTLSKFTVEGAKEYANAMVESKKMTEEQAKALIAEAQSMEDAATKVKTLTQLWDTLKEAAQSGWGQTWEILVGDFEEAKVLFTSISDVVGGIINKSAEARNAVLSDWKGHGGRSILIKSFSNIFKTLTDLITPVKEAFDSIIPKTTGPKLMKLTLRFKEFTDSLKVSEKTAENIKRTFSGVFSVFNVAIKIIKSITSVFTNLVSKVAPASGGILSITAEIGDFLVGIDKAVDSSNLFSSAIGKINEIINKGSGFFKDFMSSIASYAKIAKEYVIDIINGANNLRKSIIDAFVSAGESLKSSETGNALKNISSGLSSIADKLLDIIDSVANFSFKLFDGGNLSNFLMDGAALSFMGSTISKFSKDVSGSSEAFSGLFEGVKKIFSSIKAPFDNIGKVLDSARGSLESYQKNLDSKTLMQIAKAIALLSGSLWLLATIDSKQLTSALIAISGLFGELVGAMAVFNKISGGIKKAGQSVAMMLGLSTSILILSVAFKKLSTLDFSEVAKGLVAIGGLSAIIVLVGKKLTVQQKGIVKSSIAMVLFAQAIKTLANACSIFSAFSWEQIAKGLSGVGALLAEISAFMFVAKFGKLSVSSALGIMLLSDAIAVLTKACESFKDMDSTQIQNGLGAIGGLLVELAVFSKLTNKSKHLLSTGTAMIMMAGSIMILAKALETIGKLPLEQLFNGLGGIGVLLTEIAIALNFMKGNIGGALVMGVMAISLTSIIPALALLGKMPIKNIGKSLLALAGVFTIVGIAGYALAPVAPVIKILCGALTMLSLSIATVLGTIAALNISNTVEGLSSPFIALKDMLSLEWLKELAKTIPEVIALFIASLVKTGPIILESVLEMVPMFIEGILSFIDSILKAIVEHGPSMIASLLSLVIQLLDQIGQQLPAFISVAVDLVLGFIYGFTSKLPDIINAGFDFVIAFINGVTEGLSEKFPELLEAFIGLVEEIIEQIIGMGDKFREAAWEVITGFIEGIGDKIEDAVNGIKSFGEKVVGGLKDILGIASPSKVAKKMAHFFGDGFVNGLSDMGQSVYESAQRLGFRAKDGMHKAIDTVHSLVDSYVDYEPVIKPRIDISEIMNGSRKINGMLTSSKAIGLSASMDLQKESIPGNQNSEKSVTFNQYNYSPKALSSVEIYRRTNNQISRLRRLPTV